MLGEFLKKHITSQADYVQYGYGQVEPNHLSAQRTAQVYAQLPANKNINVLEQGQFVKYDYATHTNGIGANGEGTSDTDTAWDRQSRYYNGVDAEGNSSITVGEGENAKTYHFDDVTAAPDMYELHYNEDPFHIEGPYKEARMKEGTTMVPRVFKTNVGDIFTTNTVAETELAVGDILSPRAADGILSKSGDGSMNWQVVKVYTMPDHQRGVKIMRIV